MEEHGAEITQEDVINIIDPYLISEIDTAKLINQYKKKVANNIMARYKDEKGVRKVFNYTDKSKSKYVDIENSKDIKALKSIDKNLRVKIKGLTASQYKVRHQVKALLGQISIDDLVINKKI